MTRCFSDFPDSTHHKAVPLTIQDKESDHRWAARRDKREGTRTGESGVDLGKHDLTI